MKRNIGQEILAGLKDFAEALESGEDLAKRFVVTCLVKDKTGKIKFERVKTLKGKKS